MAASCAACGASPTSGTAGGGRSGSRSGVRTRVGRFKRLGCVVACPSSCRAVCVQASTEYLKVAPGGSKSWVQRLTIKGQRHDLGLGAWPLVTLAEARDHAYENRRLARRGGDPLGDRRKAKAPTFKQASERTREANRTRWRNVKTATNWNESMARYAYPIFGNRQVDKIGREDVLRVLTPIWTSKPELARKVRQRIRATLQWAVAHGYVEHNVAGEAIDGALPAMPAGITPRVARKRRNVGAAVTGLRRTDGPSRLARVCTNAAIVGTVSRNQPGVGVPVHSARRAAPLRRYIRRVPTTKPCTCTR